MARRANDAAYRKWVHPYNYRVAPPPFSPPSPWSRSAAKRAFDVTLVLATLPVVAPICLLIAVLVRISSKGPVFFLQKRVGLQGELFSIVKFRTMVHRGRRGKGSITRIDDARITPVGRLLRALKLDELPQFVNVLLGHMSLVGPRPRVPDQPAAPLTCRPGITGAASLAFAREEEMLAGIPAHQLNSYYAKRVVPVKQRMDAAYMARATFASDLSLLLLTIFRIWVARIPSTQETQMLIGAALPGEACD
jgi:lipopolysaccharide/colanic/teichoic acid biosynthesis glycosyltransferase